jgi:hypothetical protein
LEVCLEDGGKNRFDVIYFLYNEGLAKPDGQLKGIDELGILLSQYLYFVVSLQLLLEPGGGLRVGIYYDWNFLQETKYLTVLDGELIVRKPLHDLLQSSGLTGHEGKEVVIMTAQYLLPFLHLKMPNILRAFREVSHEARSQSSMFGHHLHLHL